jgi:hypothetical protein
MAGSISYVEYRFCPSCAGALEKRSLKTGDPDRLVCGACGFVYDLDPKVAVGTIITTADSRLVLVRGAIEPGYGLWVFPGARRFATFSTASAWYNFLPGDQVSRQIRNSVYEELHCCVCTRSRCRRCRLRRLRTHQHDHRSQRDGRGRAGAWVSAASVTPSASTCSDFKWSATEQTATTVKGTFSATCAGDLKVVGTAQGALSGSVIVWTANGTATAAPLPPCAITLTGTAEPGANSIRVPYSGDTCLGKVSGVEILNKK